MRSQRPDTVREPFLRENARVLVVAPCGPVPEEPFRKGLDVLRGWGLEVCLSPGLWNRQGYLAGPDSERLEHLVRALRDEEASAVWMARGGYGATRILRGLEDALPESPPALIGFSDGTALHALFDSRGHSCVHGPVVTQLGRLTSESLRQCKEFLFGIQTQWRSGPLESLNGIEAPSAGPTWGGNLSLLCALTGTPWQRPVSNRIVFIEDVGEPVYRIDRMLQQLRDSHALDTAAAILFGSFSEADRDPELHQLLRAFSNSLPCPVWSGIPVGHEADNWMVPIGRMSRIESGHWWVTQGGTENP